ncbi:hypothetical protein [Rhodococcus chondri]|uniref:Uncharacterized protein n=1 Tax=Rhodococcus chondri TaxID=3065941 RepID=A0ABU7JSQ5_9NOCA|nr:hypothetical protein [Rhodococcus sp. CC-R104]MEE2032322.1 hypothetical protein [Rhodococcus sp. CC-R104]
MHVQVRSKDDAVTRDLVNAVLALDPKPREVRWTSLSLCILDAVWSIGARYDMVVVPLVRRFAAGFGVESPTVRADSTLGPDPIPLSALAGLDVGSLVDRTNRQRTSTRGGILKAEAALRHFAVFVEHDVTTLAEAIELLSDSHRLADVDSALRRIPGEGGSGIRRGYLWMLVGNDDLIKPDRMVLRWLRHHGVDVSPEVARGVIATVAESLTATTGKPVTPWEVDHAMWNAGRLLPPTRKLGM